MFSKIEYCSDVESGLFWRTFRLNTLCSRKPCRLAREAEHYNAMEFDICLFVQSQIGRAEVRFNKNMFLLVPELFAFNMSVYDEFVLHGER